MAHLKAASQDIYLTQQEFDRDLEICLEILKEAKDHYVCEYTSGSLSKKKVNIFIKSNKNL
jgi:hypothetical protein